MTRKLENTEEIAKHYIAIDLWESFLCKFLSTPLVAAVQNTKLTPNHLTLIGIGINFLVAILFGVGNYFALVLGGILLQAAYVFDAADGQLARYKKMTSNMGQWLDILGDVISDGVVIAGLAFGIWSRTSNVFVIYFAFFIVFLCPFYTLHRQVRNNMLKANETGEDEHHLPGGFVGLIESVKFIPLNKKMLITFGVLLNLPKATLIGVGLLILFKFSLSIVMFIKTRSKWDPSNA